MTIIDDKIVNASMGTTVGASAIGFVSGLTFNEYVALASLGIGVISLSFHGLYIYAKNRREIKKAALEELALNQQRTLNNSIKKAMLDKLKEIDPKALPHALDGVEAVSNAIKAIDE